MSMLSYQRKKQAKSVTEFDIYHHQGFNDGKTNMIRVVFDAPSEFDGFSLAKVVSKWSRFVKKLQEPPRCYCCRY